MSGPLPNNQILSPKEAAAHGRRVTAPSNTCGLMLALGLPADRIGSDTDGYPIRMDFVAASSVSADRPSADSV